MCTAVDGVDGVGKGVDRLSVRIRVLDGGFDADIFDFLFDMHDRMQVFAVAVQIADERGDAAFKVEGHFAVGALIDELERDAARHKGHFTETLDKRIEAVVDVFGEDDLVEFKGLPCAGIVLVRFANLLDLALRHTALVLLFPQFAVALDLGGHPLGERVDGADTHAVQTARNLVSAAAELTACADHGHDHVHGFHRLAIGILLGRVRTDRNTASVILNGHTAIFMNDNVDAGAKTGKRFVDGVIHHFINKVVQRLDVCTANVHARAFADVLNAFQRLN